MEDETLKTAKRIREIIDDKHGKDIVIIDISRQSSFADYFVNATAGNARILGTAMDEVRERLEADGVMPRNIEGRPGSGWVLMDYGDIIVNLFSEEQRDNYQIDKIWSDGNFIE